MRPKDAPLVQSEAPKDRPKNQPVERKGTRTHVIPVNVWLGTETEPGLIDLPPEERRDAMREAMEDKGPMWGPPEWTSEDEKRWQRNSR